MTRVEIKELRKKVALNLFLILVLGIVLLQIARNSNFFNIKYIDLKGNDYIEQEELLKNSSIKKGVNTFDFFLFKEKSNLEKNPYIEKITIKRKLPNRIIIDIEEKKEVFKIKDIKNLIILDEKGTVLDVRSKADDKLTTINGIKLDKKISKKNVNQNIFSFIESKEIVEFLKTDREIQLLNIFKEIDFLEGNKIKIITFDNKQIEFGSIKNGEYKLKLLNEILEYIDDEDINYEKILMNKGEDPIIIRGKETEDSEENLE